MTTEFLQGFTKVAFDAGFNSEETLHLLEAVACNKVAQDLFRQMPGQTQGIPPQMPAQQSGNEQGMVEQLLQLIQGIKQQGLPEMPKLGGVADLVNREFLMDPKPKTTPAAKMKLPAVPNNKTTPSLKPRTVPAPVKK